MDGLGDDWRKYFEQISKEHEDEIWDFRCVLLEIKEIMGSPKTAIGSDRVRKVISLIDGVLKKHGCFME